MAADRQSARDLFFNTTQTDSSQVSTVEKFDQKIEDLRHLQPPRKLSIGNVSHIPKLVVTSALPRAARTADSRIKEGYGPAYVGSPPRTTGAWGAGSVKHKSDTSWTYSNESIGGRTQKGTISSYQTSRRSSESFMSTMRPTGRKDELFFRSPSQPNATQSPYSARKQSLHENTHTITRQEEQNYIPGLLDRKYNMSHTRRGTVVIFSHKEFKGAAEPREGAEEDVRGLLKSLPRLGFLPRDIVVHQDLTHREITTELRKLSIADHSKSDCLMVFVLSHGEEGETLMAKDQSYSTNEIWGPFLGDRCETLRGKPKIFFFVACRGNQGDAGVKVEQQRRPSRTLTDSRPTTKNVSYTIPIHADVLTVYSTQPLHYSFRDGERGTFYIHALCQEILKLPVGISVNFTDFLTQVNLKVGVSYEAYNEGTEVHMKRQCPSFTSTLTRLIYITPINV